MRSYRDLESDARMLDTLRTLDDREGVVLASYRRLVADDPDEAIRYLGRLLVQDEERHQKVTSEIEHRVDTWILGHDVEASIPALAPRVDRMLLATTRQLIALERQDGNDLRLLQRELRGVPASSLLPLLVRLMRLDTARHIEILRFIRSYTG